MVHALVDDPVGITDHVGAFYGYRLELHQGSTVLHRPFGCRL